MWAASSSGSAAVSASKSPLGASLLALLTAVSIWLSLGTVAVYGGDTSRIAALPSFWILGLLAVAAVAIARLAKLRLDQAWPLAISVVLWLPFFPGDLPPGGPLQRSLDFDRSGGQVLGDFVRHQGRDLTHQLLEVAGAGVLVAQDGELEIGRAHV